jgi:hypothetical protein
VATVAFGGVLRRTRAERGRGRGARERAARGGEVNQGSRASRGVARRAGQHSVEAAGGTAGLCARHAQCQSARGRRQGRETGWAS